MLHTKFKIKIRDKLIVSWILGKQAEVFLRIMLFKNFKKNF